MKMEWQGKIVETRETCSREKLDEMIAHCGKCKYCGEVVKMPRDPEGNLRPEYCHCILCGQSYYMEIDDLKEWEIEQWAQKALKL